MTQFILYGTLGCHLCELAEAQLATLLAEAPSHQIEIELIDISVNDALLIQYGERIPVLQRASNNAEINWPFDAAQLRTFLLK